MTATYDPTDLDSGTSSGRLNIVRLEIQDTDTNSAILQDEEINYYLTLEGDDTDETVVRCLKVIASRFSQEPNIDLDGQLAIDFSDLSDKYYKLANLKEKQIKDGKGSFVLGMVGGATTKSDYISDLNNPNRLQPAFKSGQFDNPTYGDLDE